MLRPTIALLLALIGNTAAQTLSVEITDIRSAEGKLMVAVVAGADGFADKVPPALSLILPARTGTVSFSTDALATGDYAIRVMHDVNGNAKLDTNFVGMPTEPFGFSNDASGSFGPPKWDAARFTIGTDGATQHIRLNH